MTKTKKANARRAEKSAKAWRTVYIGPRDRKTAVLRSPEGVEYRGTRGEVSAAGLVPVERRMLADDLRVAHMLSDPDERREACERRRREAIEAHAPPGGTSLAPAPRLR